MTDVAEPSSASARLLTPSRLSAWLACSHSLSLARREIAGALVVPARANEMADLLADKGLAHERACLEELVAAGRNVVEVPAKGDRETFDDWFARVRHYLDEGHEILYQMPLVFGGSHGVADFLERVDDHDGRPPHYEPIDAKLARAEARPGHVLQLCFYAEALESLTGVAPARMHLWLGGGQRETLVTDEFTPYWRRLKGQVARLLDDDELATRARPCVFCQFCRYQSTCRAEWEATDSVVLTAGARTTDAVRLEAAGVATLVQLSQGPPSVPGMNDERVSRLAQQARLQVASRTRGGPPAYEIVTPSLHPTYGRGFEQVPPPDEGDVFFDFEGHPFWSAQRGLFFLAGLLYRRDGEWVYDARWAHDEEAEERMAAGLVDFFEERRDAFPGAHVYHYNHTERSSLARLVAGTGDEGRFIDLDAQGFFVDLLPAVQNAVRIGVESYSLKDVEHAAGFERREREIHGGAGAVLQYDEWMSRRDDATLQEIARYNEDDVRATRAVRDWLNAERPAGVPWRPAVLERLVSESTHHRDQVVAALTERDSETDRVLAPLLAYWGREFVATIAPLRQRLATAGEELTEDDDALGGLVFRRMDPPSGQQKAPRAVYEWPEQFFRSGDETSLSVVVGLSDGDAVPATAQLNRATREIAITWSARFSDPADRPAYPPEMVHAVATYDWVSAKTKEQALIRHAETSLAGAPPAPLWEALLRGERATFDVEGLPPGGIYGGTVDEMASWVTHLNGGVLAVQGPPGTGKTFAGGAFIVQLVAAGRRVGVTATAHSAIENLLKEVVKRAREAGRELKILYKVTTVPDEARRVDGVEYHATLKKTTDLGEYDVVAGTSWFFVNDRVVERPVDVLIVDEAGQYAFTDAVVSSPAARAMVLLGDPLQLPQVTKAEHPGRSGASVLAHVLGEHDTIPISEGVFLDTTRRMHPDVTSFISRQIYEGRLHSYPDCARQTTPWGTGLRWIQVRHAGNATESAEEGALIVECVTAMVGHPWTDRDGVGRELGEEDFLVVVPYNDQRRLLRRLLDEAGWEGVKVGTVDKFQGQEAPIVFFSMTSSSPEDMPRDKGFLFSKNRLNVAVSRARCLAVLLCTEELLNAKATSVADMRLVGCLCAFVEGAATNLLDEVRR